MHLQVFGSAALPHGCVSEGVALLSFRAHGVSEPEDDNVWSHDSKAGLLSTYIQELFLFYKLSPHLRNAAVAPSIHSGLTLGSPEPGLAAIRRGSVSVLAAHWCLLTMVHF